MNRKLISYLGTLSIVILLLFGCTPYIKGNMHLERKNYEAAIENYQKDLSKNPNHWEARQRLGYAYLQTGQPDHAIHEFERILRQKPGDSFSTYHLGLAYLNKGERGKAAEIWRTYQNKEAPEVEQEINRQLSLVEISDSIHLARQALADEARLKTLPPKSGTVAVFYFRDSSPDQRFRPLQKAMATLIITDLSQVQSLQVLERLRIQFLLTEMQLGQTGIVEEKTAPRAGRLLGAENLIVGTMEPGSLAVKTSVASTTKDDVVGAFSVTAEMEEFYKLQKEIVYNILKTLDVEYTPEEEERFKQYQTKNLQAVIYFGQGLEAQDLGKWREARVFFEKAVEEDPEFELARKYRDGTPSASAPTIASLGTMTTDELANNINDQVLYVEGTQEEITRSLTAAAPSEPEAAEPGPTPPAATGSVTFGW